MTTSTVFARGSEWGQDTLYDGWGSTCSDRQTKLLAALVVQRFEQIAESEGSAVYWQPQTSEVIGEVIGQGEDKWLERRDDGRQTTEEQLKEWREQAFAEVWAAVVGDGSGLLCAAVEAVFSG